MSEVITTLDVAPESVAQKRVLIVDDDRDFSAAIGEILDSEGYEVRLAHNTADAVETLQEYGAHVALLDIRLGRESGIELIGQLHRIRPDILCVMMTGHAALETAIQALQQGAYNYLRKPVDGTDLLATLERCFERILLQEDKVLAESALSVRNRELEALTVRLRHIVESVRRLAACTNLDHLIPLLLKEATNSGGAIHSRLFLRRAGGYVEFHGNGVTEPTADPPEFLTESMIKTLSTTMKPVVVPTEALTEESILLLPLFGESETIAGVITLYRDLKHPFTTQDVELGSLLSSVCSEILRSAEATEAVAAGEQRYKLLADNVADLIWTIDFEEQLSFISPSVVTMRGYTVEEAMAQRLDQRMTSESAALVREILQQMKSGATSPDKSMLPNQELELRHKDGSLVPTETSLSPLTDGAGKAIGLLAVSRNIADRKRAEEARFRLAAAVEHAAESIMITDVDGAIQYVNPAFEALTGYTRAEALGKTPRILKSDRHDREFYQDLWDTLKRGEVWTGRFVNRTKADKFVEEEATISAIRDGRGKIINFVSVARNVTHEVELEHQLRQAQKMEAIGTLAGGIAHDFNNMLSPILGYAELIMTEVDPDSELYFGLSEISNAGKRASKLVDQILAFGRRSDHGKKPVRVSTILEEAMRLLRGTLPSTISIELDVSDTAPILADPTQIHQVIMNLCTNSYHAMRDTGGTLTIRLRNAVVEDSIVGSFDTPREDCVLLKVTDTGQGMDADTLDRIFEPYFTTKKVGEGTGLGLATVHGIVQSHGGEIHAESEVNKGTTFSIYLPTIKTESPIEIAPKTDERKWCGNERIMVVDDEEAIVAMLCRGLGTLGYQTRGFSSSEEAIQSFSDAPDQFDLLITDQTMPNMTGLELSRRMLAINPNFPVILATGYSDTVDEHVAKETGIREFMLKPMSPRSIAERVRHILDDCAEKP